MFVILSASMFARCAHRAGSTAVEDIAQHKTDVHSRKCRLFQQTYLQTSDTTEGLLHAYPQAPQLLEQTRAATPLQVLLRL